MSSLSFLVLLNFFFLICLSHSTSTPHTHTQPPPPPPPSTPKPICPPPPLISPRTPPPPSIQPICPPPPLLIPPPPPPPPKGDKPPITPPPSLPPPSSQPCKCSVSLKTLGACVLVLRGVAVGFTQRICCNGLKKLSVSNVSSCICFVFKSNVGNSSKLKLTVEEAKKVIAVACNL